MRNLLLAARKAERAEPSEQSGRASGRARTKPLLRVTAGDAEAPSRKSRIATPSQADHLRQPLAPKGYAQLYNAARSAPFGSAVLRAANSTDDDYSRSTALWPNGEERNASQD